MTPYHKYRLLEILPGLLVWGTFAATFVLAFLAPIWAIYFVIVFDLFWLLRISHFLSYTLLGYLRYRREIKIDWAAKCDSIPSAGRMIHLIFIPTYQEPVEVLREVFEALQRSTFSRKRFIVVLAGEQRDEENFTRIANQLSVEYGDVFYRMIVTIHPKGLEGEVPGKGSNLAWAGRKAREVIDELHIPYEDVIVSSFDADTVVHPQYFSYLTYRYCTHPSPTRASFQPIPLFNNNVWESHAFTRVISYSTTFWLMSEQLRPERLSTFSSHSMSMKALVEIGFWQPDIVTEDSRIGLQGVMHYDGQYRVEPLYIPLSMDIVAGKSFLETVKSQYVQQRRWAYGIENFPWMVWNFGTNRRMPFLTKFRYIFNQLEGVYSWATAPIVIFILGRLPLWLANRETEVAAIAQNAPLLLRWLMTAAMIGIFSSAILGATLLPPRPRGASSARYLLMLVQWAFLPITLILFGSIPATDAVTRLMLGKYLGFDVTKKIRERKIAEDHPS